MSRGRFNEQSNYDRIIDCSGSIIGARGQAGHDIIGNVIALVEAGKIRPDVLIDKIIPMTEAARVLSGEDPPEPGRIIVRLNADTYQ
jgi:threonine dehydrogenase-like Zn-dependent dehydrogenase